jgi:hypothetical protein
MTLTFELAVTLYDTEAEVRAAWDADRTATMYTVNQIEDTIWLEEGIKPKFNPRYTLLPAGFAPSFFGPVTLT